MKDYFFSYFFTYKILLYLRFCFIIDFCIVPFRRNSNSTLKWKVSFSLKSCSIFWIFQIFRFFRIVVIFQIFDCSIFWIFPIFSIFPNVSSFSHFFAFSIFWKLLKMSHLNFFKFWHFPPIFVLLKLTCQVTLFDSKIQVFKNSPKWTIFGILSDFLSTKFSEFSEFLNFSNFFDFLNFV